MKIPNRSLVQLAHVGDLGKDFVGEWFLSEKLDGQRALWDGGITRGMSVYDVPFANVEKQERYTNEGADVCTGLWSRYGHPIHAPDWWLDCLPDMPLDGELWLGHGSFQQLMSLTRRLEPASGWDQVAYMVFDTPTYSEIFELGVINETHYKKLISPSDLLSIIGGELVATHARPFGARVTFMNNFISSNSVVRIHHQERLPYDQLAARLLVEKRLGDVVSGGGEGVMLRCPNSYWTPRRSHKLLKIKEVRDAEGVVVGYMAAQTGKLHGMLGALIIEFNGKVFELSGFTDLERQLTPPSQFWALSNPGAKLPVGYSSTVFPIGSVVTFKYRELTDDGLPKEARYLR